MADKNRQLGGAVPGVAAPVGNEEAVKCVVEKTVVAFGRLGILANSTAAESLFGRISGAAVKA